MTVKNTEGSLNFKCSHLDALHAEVDAQMHVLGLKKEPIIRN